MRGGGFCFLIFYIFIMFKILFKAFERLALRSDAKAEQKFIKKLIPRYAAGNVLAQQGRFLVSKDIERRKRKIFSYHFGAP
jgi:hypothetical protein